MKAVGQEVMWEIVIFMINQHQNIGYVIMIVHHSSTNKDLTEVKSFRLQAQKGA